MIGRRNHFTYQVVVSILMLIGSDKTVNSTHKSANSSVKIKNRQVKNWSKQIYVLFHFSLYLLNRLIPERLPFGYILLINQTIQNENDRWKSYRKLVESIPL